MSVENAQLVFFIIMSIAVCVWAHSLVRTLKLGRNEPPERDPFGQDFSADEQDTDSAVTGARTVRGDSETLSRALAHAVLHQSVPGMFTSLFELVERSSERVVIRKTGPLVCNQPSGLYFTEAEFDLEYVGEDAVEISYRVSFDRLTKKLRRIALGLILGLGLPCILIGGGLMWFFVVSHGNPGIRWQVFQTLQLVHVLWPPFLLIRMDTAGRRHARTYISNMLISLELAT